MTVNLHQESNGCGAPHPGECKCTFCEVFAAGNCPGCIANWDKDRFPDSRCPGCNLVINPRNESTQELCQYDQSLTLQYWHEGCVAVAPPYPDDNEEEVF